MRDFIQYLTQEILLRFNPIDYSANPVDLVLDSINCALRKSVKRTPEDY